MLKTIHLFILLVILCLVKPAFSQHTDTLEYPKSDTSGAVSESNFPLLQEQEQRQYRKDTIDGKALDSTTWKNLTKDLNYDDTPVDPPKEKPTETLEKSWHFPKFSINSALTKYVLFALVIAVLLYLLYRLIGSAIFAADPKINKVTATFEILHDDKQMMEKDLTHLLEEALRQKDYKTAIRILFIQSLQELQSKEWIQWKKEKTNRDYLNELIQREAFVPFSSMVLLYEKAWYSESAATEEDLEAFKNFKQQIRTL